MGGSSDAGAAEKRWGGVGNACIAGSKRLRIGVGLLLTQSSPVARPVLLQHCLNVAASPSELNPGTALRAQCPGIVLLLSMLC